jgi:hypothetical protein
MFTYLSLYLQYQKNYVRYSSITIYSTLISKIVHLQNSVAAFSYKLSLADVLVGNERCEWLFEFGNVLETAY